MEENADVVPELVSDVVEESLQSLTQVEDVGATQLLKAHYPDAWVAI